MLEDIQTPNDIKLLLDQFYAKVLHDETIGYVFTEVAQINLPHHMPILYSFWESILLGIASYNGNPILKHIELNKKEALTDMHFTQWKKLFFETIDENFQGPIANLAKEKANAMQWLMQHKIAMSEQAGFIQ